MRMKKTRMKKTRMKKTRMKFLKILMVEGWKKKRNKR
jgi:hypothetical protein